MSNISYTSNSKNAINVSELLKKEISISYGSTTTSYLDFDGVNSENLQSQYFNISPRITKGVYDNLVSALENCASISTVDSKYEEQLASEINTGIYNSYKYQNSIYSNSFSADSLQSNSYIDNKYILKYEDIIGSVSGSAVHLTEDTNILTFLNSIKSSDASINSTFQSLSDFTGAFLYPDLDTISQLTIDGDNLLIKPGESVAVPITFEYFLPIDTSTDSKSSIKKSLVFAIKDSLYEDEKYFEVELTGNASSASINSIYSGIDNLALDNEITNTLL